MVVGNRYRVRFRFPGQKVDREFVGTFLGEDNGDSSFSMRPEAGTSSLPNKYVIYSTEVTGNVKHHTPRKVKKGG